MDSFISRDIKAAFVLGENDFRKSFSPFSACLVATENTIFRKLHSYWPKFTPLTRKWIYVLIFTSIHFRVTLHAQQHREKREAKHKTNAHTATQRAPIHAQQHREKERTSSDPHFISPIHSDPRTREVRSTHSNTERNRERAPTQATRAPIQSDPRTRELRSTNQREQAPIHERSTNQRERAPIHEPELRSMNQRSDPRTSAPIHKPSLWLTNELRSSSTKRTPVQPLRSPSQTLITVSFPSPVHRPHTHLTSDPHMSDPHTHLTGPISAFIYLFIYLFIYFYFIYYIF